MRYPLAALLVALTACAADPVLLPDGGPCGGACGPGTVCVGSACVSPDGGAADAGTVDVGGGADVQSAPDVPDVFVQPDGSPLVDVGVDAGTADVDQRTSAACRAVTAVCDGRTVDVQVGERDGGTSGRVYHCGGCGRTCAAGEGCLDCNCVRL